MEQSTRNSTVKSLSLFFWGWPVVYLLLVVVAMVIVSGQPAGQSTNHIPALIAVAVIVLSALAVEVIVLRGAIKKRISWTALLTAFAHYGLLCLLFVVWFFPCHFLSFILMGFEGITATGADIWPAYFLFMTVPLAIWLPTSGRALWRLLLLACGVTPS